MPRKKQWPPSRLPHKPSGQDRVRINGHDYWLGPIGSEQADQEYQRIVIEMATGQLPPVPARAMLVKDVVLAFSQHAKSYYSAPHCIHIHRALRPVLKLYGHTLAVDFKKKAFRAVAAQLEQDRFCGRCRRQPEDCRCGEAQRLEPLCRRHINGLLVLVRKAFRWCAEEELIPEEVADRLSCLDGLRKRHTTAEDHPPVEPVDETAIEAVLPHLLPTVAAMVRVQQYGGMRPGEVCLMRPCDLDRVGVVVDGVRVWAYRLDENKNDWRGQSRHIALGPLAQELLGPYLDRDPGSYCFVPAEAVEAHRLARRTTENPPRRKAKPQWAAGDRYTGVSYYCAIRNACDRAGVPRWHPHQIRHRAGTDAFLLGGSHDAQAMLGHRSPRATGIYTDIFERAARVAAKLG